jgi:hypothetical protein
MKVLFLDSAPSIHHDRFKNLLSIFGQVESIYTLENKDILLDNGYELIVYADLDITFPYIADHIAEHEVPIVGISWAWARGLSIDCGCFGGGGPVEPGTANYLPKLLRDLGLAVMGIYLFLLPQSKFALDKFATHETSDQKENKDEQ